MPITLPPISRRRFLGGSLAAGAGLMWRHAPAWSADVPAADPECFALLSDTNVDADRAAASRGIVMWDNMARAVADIVKHGRRPAAILHGGDCVHLVGRAADYAALVESLRPLREAGLPIHLALGNHDDRENFRKAFPAGEDAAARPVADRHVAVVESPRANWFLLDSLMVTRLTPGNLGEAQLKWLAAALDARAGKPALLLVHHQPELTGRPAISGILDSKALLDVILPRRQVKAVFFGHTHDWNVAAHEGVHMVNLPPVAYVFDAARAKPSGWVEAVLGEAEVALQLRCLDPAHAQHGERHKLRWRK